MLEPEGSFSCSLILQLESREVKQGFPHFFSLVSVVVVTVALLFSKMNICTIIQVQPFLWIITVTFK